MMKILKIFAAAMILVLAFSAFGACSNKGGENNTASTSVKESETVSVETDSHTQPEETETDAENIENSQPAESFTSDEDDLEILTIPQSEENSSETEEFGYVTESELESGPVIDMGDGEDPLGNAHSIELPFVPAP